MKKLLIVMVVALLAIALVACGGEETPTTTKGDATTPTVTTPKDVTTTPKDVTTTPKAPGTSTATTTPGTTTPGTTEYVPPVQKEIDGKMETAWWNDVHTMNPIQYTKNADGTMSYTWSFTIKAESGLFLNFPEDHDTYPSLPGIQLTTAEGAYVYIKDMAKDEDFTKYSIKAGSWRTERWCDIWFEAEDFIPEPEAQYDMYLFFQLPNVEGATPYPGEEIYVWALERAWTYNAPIVIGDPIVDDAIKDGYSCTVHRHSERGDISWAEGDNAPADFDPAKFPVMNFNFTVKAEDKLFPSGTDSDGNRTESFAEIIPEGAFAFIKGPNDTNFTRYECDYMLTERWCDMWFTLKEFTPEAGVQYEMVFCFMSGVSATHPYTLHYVYAKNWMAGPTAQ
ncbi:MAG: hypothetical protein IKM34_07115 [Clostridia bacterium]|nr:hypothetical protein [Clostridia bacterium]